MKINALKNHRKESTLGKLNRFIRVVVFANLLILSLIQPLNVSADVFAQPQPSLEVSNIDTREFPLIRFDTKPRHLPDPAVDVLNNETLQVLEDGKVLSLHTITETYEGIDLGLAINPGLDLAWRDLKGVSRYDKLIQAFRQLNQVLTPGSGDRFSLFMNPDYEVTNLTDLDSLLISLANYPENMRKMETNFKSLERALEVLSTDESKQDKTLLYITVLPYPADAKKLDSLLTTAQQNDITINIWLTGLTEIVDYPQIPYLRNLAEGSGGSLFLFSGSEPIPDPTNYVLGLGKRYQVSYLSQVRENGSHQLALSLQTSAGLVTSPDVPFSVEVLPAEVQFINLPEALSIQTDAKGLLSPAELPLEITVSFPDNHPRSTTKASLWVNGTLYQQNSSAPYFNFLLKFQDFPSSQALKLQARIEDEFGLTGESQTFSLDLEILPSSTSQSVPFWRNPVFLALSAILIIGLTVLFFLPAYHKRKPQKLKAQIQKGSIQLSPSPQNILATLTRIDKDNIPLPEKPIPITQALTLIGRDEELCQLVFSDPTLEPLHCQLRLLPDGNFRLTDFHSSAGTWVNNTPVGQSGMLLQHGDLIQIGSITFRFSNGSRLGGEKPERAIDSEP